MADSISIEETNKVRQALGLKPLPVPGQGPQFKDAATSSSEDEDEAGSTLESRQAQGYENWKKLKAEQDAVKQRQAKKDAVKRARDAAQRFSRLEGKGLGDADPADEENTRTWLLQQKKRQKKLDKERERARRTEEELQQREARDYTSRDLAGVRVAHEASAFDDEGGEQILTLKDATIEENEEEGDELENVGLVEREKLDEKLNLKKRKPAYDPTQINEDGSSTVLQQYDEVIDGKKRKRFTLDGEGQSAEPNVSATKPAGIAGKAQPISLDILQDLPTNDYQEVREVKIKKPKKKKSKHTRQRAQDPDDDEAPPKSNGRDHSDVMEVDGVDVAPAAPRRREHTAFVDDEDLQASLARQRRDALKKRKKVKPEDLARQIREEASATPNAGNGGASDDEEEGGLVLDETSEFIANLQRPEPEAPRRTATSGATSKIEPLEPSSKVESDDDDQDVDMQESYNAVEDESERQARVKRESSHPEPETLPAAGLEEETTLSRGIGSTLNLLSQRGIIQKSNADELAGSFRDRQLFLREKLQREEAAEAYARQQRERDRASGKLTNMSARDREEYARRENRQRDQFESRQMAELFDREYRPDVQLRYVDDHGRHLSQKEAFKQMSHQFHGKGSGKQKTEKRLKKIQEEKSFEAQSSLDSAQGRGISHAVEATNKKNRQAGVRLA